MCLPYNPTAVDSVKSTGISQGCPGPPGAPRTLEHQQIVSILLTFPRTARVMILKVLISNGVA